MSDNIDEFDLNLGTLSTTFEGISHNFETMRLQGTPSTNSSSNRGVSQTESRLTGESSPPAINVQAVIASAPSRKKFKLWWVPEGCRRR